MPRYNLLDNVRPPLHAAISLYAVYMSDLYKKVNSEQ